MMLTITQYIQNIKKVFNIANSIEQTVAQALR